MNLEVWFDLFIKSQTIISLTLMIFFYENTLNYELFIANSMLFESLT